MKNHFFDLDRVFELVKTGALLNKYGYQIAQPFPDLANTINGYQNSLSKLQNAPITMSSGSGEVYDRIIHFSSYGHYRLYWNIPEAVSVIRSRNIRLLNIPLHNLIKSVDVDNLNLANLNSGHFQPHPVIVAKFPMVPERAVVIDGNHTVYQAYHQGFHGIKGYLLEIEDHLPAMTSDLFRTLFAIHANISSIISFMSTPNATLKDIVLYPVPYEL